MLDPDIRSTLLEASKLTQDIGRMLGSPKNNLENLDDLNHALKSVAKVVKSLRKTQLNRYKETLV